MIPHLYFRKMPWQDFRRCMTCGFVAKKPGAHVAHAHGRDRAEVTL